MAYTFSRANTMAPFRDLLQPSTKFTWTTEHQETFEESKKIIIEQINRGVEIFEKDRPTCIATDWSKIGIGYWMFQKHCACPTRELFCCNDGWRITLVGSRFTHAAESRYAAIEGEALAVAEALEKCRHFILGCSELYVAVDHKPLVKIFGDRALADITNSRLRNLKEKTLMYDFTMLYIPGVRNNTSDALSRYPTGSRKLSLPDVMSAPPPKIPLALMAGLSVDQPDEEDEEDLIVTLCSVMNSMVQITWQLLKEQTTTDDTMQLLLQTIEEGFPQKQADTPKEIREYHIHRSHLCSTDGVAVYKDRVIIPVTLREDCLKALHSAHHGVTMMLSKAEASIFWPGIAADISDHRSTCNKCNEMSPSQSSLPPTPPVLPTRPFQSICADYFHNKGHTYVVIVDRYSNWHIVERSCNGATGLVGNLRSIFVTFGIPEDITTDGGPEFTASVTRKFLADWGVHHRTSTVSNPHANCRAEIGVKTIKRALAGNTPDNGDLNTDSFQKATLAYRNTPDPVTKVSPAIAMFARPFQDLLPVLPGKLRLHDYWDRLLDDREKTMADRGSREHDKWSEHSRPLTPLMVGDKVRVQNQSGLFPRRWDKLGIVTEVKQFHQYWVRMLGSGRASLRNRKFLRKCSPSTSLVVPAFQNVGAPPIHTTLPDQVVESPSIPVPAYIPETTRIVDPPSSPPPSPQSPASAPVPQRTPSSPVPTATRRLLAPPPPRRSSRKCVLDHRPNYKD